MSQIEEGEYFFDFGEITKSKNVIKTKQDLTERFIKREIEQMFYLEKINYVLRGKIQLASNFSFLGI